ncbi:MAG: CoA-binding protein [Thermodesulfobacteriota bacterium]|nr:CoA-binding protein [Thermodesulfobacteriota bacterium]
MTDHPLYQIMHPKSVAIAGASNDFTKMGTIQLLNLLGGKYPGKIYPIHPQETTVLGLQAFPNARELPEPVDLAILTLPTSAVPGVLEDLGVRGVKRAIIISGGFKEVGEKGGELEALIVKIARKYDIRFLGPNCIGVIHPAFHLNPTMYPYLHQPGSVGVASQSGTYVTQIIPLLAKLQIGYSQALSVGNAANLDLVDCLEYLGSDPETKAIAVYIEGIKRPREFIKTSYRVTREKPIVALYVGGTEAGARSAASHTGAISGPDNLYDALLGQSGVLRAYSVEDLYEWAFALASLPLPGGRNMAILTHSGGPASSLADACNRLGLKVPVFSESLQAKIRQLLPATGSYRNPVDLTFFMDMNVLMEKLPRIILADPAIDGLLIHGVQGSSYFRSVGGDSQDLVEYSALRKSEKFFLVRHGVLRAIAKDIWQTGGGLGICGTG